MNTKMATPGQVPSLPSLPNLPSLPSYTVEQIELIRRLRNSGISKDQLMQAYEAFERLDQELGPMYYMPNPLLAQTLMSQAQVQAQAQLAAVQMQMVAAQQQQQQQQQNQQTNTDTPNNKNKVPPLMLPSTPVEELAPLPSHISPQELEDKLKEFILKGDQACCEEIRDFVQKNQIRQQQVAVLAGISQPYVSRFLKGDFRDMSARSRHAIHRWYLIYKDSPELTAVDYLQRSVIRRQFDYNTPPCESSGFTPRRERFVFRPRHVEILEKHFEEDSYPTQERKEEIAQECNAALEATGNHAGRLLSEKERVSPQVVGTWFANKRKDLKKIAREEGLDGELAWRPRGRPRQWTNEPIPATMAQSPMAQSPGEQSMDRSPPHSQTIMLDNNTAVVLDHDADDQSVAKAVEEAAVSHAITSISGTWLKRENEPQDLSNGHHVEKTTQSECNPIQEAVNVQNGNKTSNQNGVASITGNWVKVEAHNEVMAS